MLTHLMLYALKIEIERVKCILRFAYTNSFSDNPSEPSKSILLNHINQLMPILTANQDAILAMQAGFVGPWGEWHSSTNFDNDLEGRQEIVSKLLDAVPHRNVQIRTPAHKQSLYSTNAPPVVASSGHVSNGDFEGPNVGSAWENYMDGYVIDTSDYNGGSQSIKVTNGGARQLIGLDKVEEGYMIEVSGYSKRVGGE